MVNTVTYMQKIPTLSVKNREIKKSKAAAQNLYKQIKYHKDGKLFGSCETIVSIFGWNHKNFIVLLNRKTILKFVDRIWSSWKKRNLKSKCFKMNYHKSTWKVRQHCMDCFLTQYFFRHAAEVESYWRQIARNASMVHRI